MSKFSEILPNQPKKSPSPEAEPTYFSQILEAYEHRPAQVAMAEAVQSALDSEQTLLVEAATGTGKTWAYLIPAILSGKKVIVSTGTKNLQDQLFFKDLPQLAKMLSVPFTYSMMKGKSNYLCLHRFHQTLQQPLLTGFNVESELEIIHDWMLQTERGDRSEITALPEYSPVWQEVAIKSEACLGGQCHEFERCYLTRMKQEAAASDIIVVNHHLFFADLSLKDNAYGEVLPRYQAVVFDEAHALEEVATQFFGLSFSSLRVDDFVRDAENAFRYSKEKDPDGSKQIKMLHMYAKHFFQYFKKGPERYRLRKRDFSEETLSAGADLQQSFKSLDRIIEKQRFKSDSLKQLGERIEMLSNDLETFLLKDKETKQLIYWAEHRRNAVFLHSSPLDVSAVLRERLFEGECATILTSATMSTKGDFSFIKSRLGIEHAEEALFDTAFDYQKQALLYLPTHLPPPSAAHFPEAVAEEIARILMQSHGRAFLLFTSWRNLEAVYQAVAPKLPYRLLRQGDQPKQKLIETFKADISSVLFGTTSFWQGVDVAGEALSCVIIDKLPFASPGDPLTSARMDDMAQQGKSPFMDFQLPLAILSLRQGIGRLIRKNSDRGLLAIMDHRISKKSYGKKFLDSLPDAPRSSNFKDVVSFFRAE